MSEGHEVFCDTIGTKRSSRMSSGACEVCGLNGVAIDKSSLYSLRRVGRMARNCSSGRCAFQIIY